MASEVEVEAVLVLKKSLKLRTVSLVSLNHRCTDGGLLFSRRALCDLAQVVSLPVVI